MERKKDDKFDARGSPTNRYPGEVVKCERNYRRNHLRRYRITRIKRRRQGEEERSGKERERERHRGERRRSTQKAGTNEQVGIPPGNACKATSFLISSLRRSPAAPSSLFFSLAPVFPSFFFPLARLSLSCSAVRTRSSSVIDRNLSLTSLPPGAKILPVAPVASTFVASSSPS